MRSAQRVLVVMLVAAFALMTGCAAPKPSWAMRINAGAMEDYKAPSGDVWLKGEAEGDAPAYVQTGGGSVDRGEIEIAKTDLDRIYQTELFDMDTYKITVPVGKTYTVKLHFAETYEGVLAAGERVFDVKINDKMAVEKMDPFKEAGGSNTAVVKTIKGVAPAEDGTIKIAFVAHVQSPEINGIEVLAE